jgi:hypothetical protein
VKKHGVWTFFSFVGEKTWSWENFRKKKKKKSILITQCARMELNKRSLPKPTTTAG